MQIPHILKGNKKSERPSNIFFFDTETKVVVSTLAYEEVVLQLWVSCYVELDKKGKVRIETWNEGFTEESLFDELLRHTRDNTRLYVISSNIYFDIRVSNTLKTLFELEWKLKRGYVKGMTFIMLLRNNKKTIALINLQNILPCSIKALGAILGIHKIEIDIPSASFETLVL